jgi:hypothetical protein
MHVYGAQSFIVAYACESASGEVKLSDEHSASRWIDPVEYRERYFSGEGIEKLRAVEPHIAELAAAVRLGIDEYLDWRARRTRPAGDRPGERSR